LNNQIIEYLESITLPEEFLTWSLDVLKENNQLEENNKAKIITTHNKNLENCTNKIDNTIQLYVSPENKNHKLLSEEDYIRQKSNLLKEKELIKSEIEHLNSNGEKWLELTQNTFEFATYAKHWFEKGSYEKKTSILKQVGKSHYLINGQLNIELQEPLEIIKKRLSEEVPKTLRLEPALDTINKQKSNLNKVDFAMWSG